MMIALFAGACVLMFIAGFTFGVGFALDTFSDQETDMKRAYTPTTADVARYGTADAAEEAWLKRQVTFTQWMQAADAATKARLVALRAVYLFSDQDSCSGS